VFKFREIWPTANRWNGVLLTWQKNSPGSPAVATAWVAPKICQGQPPTMYSQCARFHPNWFTFGGVMTERVNTVKTRRKVNPIFGWSLASSRIINSSVHYIHYYNSLKSSRLSTITDKQSVRLMCNASFWPHNNAEQHTIILHSTYRILCAEICLREMAQSQLMTHLIYERGTKSTHPLKFNCHGSVMYMCTGHKF